jgi:hypothetical protein
MQWLRSKKISVMTRPRDVIAGGSGGIGRCPPPQHQPQGIIEEYICYRSGIYPDKYARCIPDIYQIYTIPVWYISGIYQVNIPSIIMSFVKV